jgi:LytR cell envelope-related transcriptional attenuator
VSDEGPLPELPQLPHERVSRLRRRERERKRRTVELLVTVAIVALGVTYAIGQSGGGASAGGPSSTPTVVGHGTPALLIVEVTGAPKPLLAVVGTRGTPPAAMGIPQGLTMEIPGAGELATRQVAALPGPSLQVAVSNVVGAWAPHYAITDLTHLVAMVDRAGGLRIQLPGAVTVDGGSFGPGHAKMTGQQVADYLGAPDQNTFTRWEIVLTGLLASPPHLVREDLTDTDDLSGVQETLAAAKGARMETLPVVEAAATLRVPDYPELDRLMAKRFRTRTPDPVIVQNGVGVAALGEQVGRLIIPRGFRVMLSQNAVSFDQQVTQIEALGGSHLGEARRIRAALGVGRIRVSQVASGIGEVQIVVGKDFTA